MSGTRTGAIERARKHFDGGAFLGDLSRRVAIKTESQKFPEASAIAECHRYLEAEMRPAFQAMGFTCKIYDNPISGQGPVLLATRIEDPKLPTVLGYGHGDVVRGLEDQWTKGKGPWITARDGDRLYGRGTADNKGQHTHQHGSDGRRHGRAWRQARLQCQIHDRDGRGSGLEGPQGPGQSPTRAISPPTYSSPPTARA